MADRQNGGRRRDVLDEGARRARNGGDHERGDWDARGDWRQGYGGYGVSGRGGMHEDRVVERAPDYEGLSGGYGLGGMADTGRGDEPPYVEPRRSRRVQDTDPGDDVADEPYERD